MHRVWPVDCSAQLSSAVSECINFLLSLFLSSSFLPLSLQSDNISCVSVQWTFIFIHLYREDDFHLQQQQQRDILSVTHLWTFTLRKVFLSLCLFSLECLCIHNWLRVGGCCVCLYETFRETLSHSVCLSLSTWAGMRERERGWMLININCYLTLTIEVAWEYYFTFIMHYITHVCSYTGEETRGEDAGFTSESKKNC